MKHLGLALVLGALVMTVPTFVGATEQETTGTDFRALTQVTANVSALSDEELGKIEGQQAQANVIIGPGGLISVQAPINANDVVDVTLQNNQIAVNVGGQQVLIQRP